MARMDDYFVVIFISGCLFFPCLYLICINILKSQRFYSLTCGDVYVITERIVCTIQSLFACVSGAIIVCNCVGDVLHDTHWLTKVYGVFGTPYFYYDIVAMAVTHSYLHPPLRQSSWRRVVFDLLKSRPLVIIHHFVFPIIYLPVIVWWRHDLGDFFVGCFYMEELTIPYLSLQAALIQLKKKDSKLYIINGLMLIATWFICRVLIFPFMYWMYGQQHGIYWWNVPQMIPIKCNIGCLLLFAFQVYWLAVMLRIAYKTLCPQVRTLQAQDKVEITKQS